MGQQRVQRHAREVRVRIPRLAVRERQLGAFDHRVDVLGGEKSCAAQVTRLEKAQLLQENRSLAPRAALGDRPPFEVGRHGRLMARCISREVAGGEETRMRESGAVHDL